MFRPKKIQSFVLLVLADGFLVVSLSRGVAFLTYRSTELTSKPQTIIIIIIIYPFQEKTIAYQYPKFSPVWGFLPKGRKLGRGLLLRYSIVDPFYFCLNLGNQAFP